MRNLDVHVLNTLNRMFLQDDQPYNHINSSELPFINEYMKIVAKYAPLWWKYQEEFPEIFQVRVDTLRILILQSSAPRLQLLWTH